MSPSAARVAAKYVEYKGTASVDDTNALVMNIAMFSRDQLDKAGFNAPADMEDQTIPYMQAITTAPWGGGPKADAKKVASRYLTS